MTTIAGIHYDNARHLYTAADDGRVIRSVTQVLKSAGLIDTRFFTQAGCDRGTAVHEATEDMDIWDADWNQISEITRPYAKAYMKFIDTARPAIINIEQNVYFHVLTAGKVYEYCGRYDRLVKLSKYPYLILDIKTGAPQWWHKVQGVAYCMAEGSGAWPCCLYLRNNGTYSLDIQSHYDYQKARADWIKALTKEA